MEVTKEMERVEWDLYADSATGGGDLEDDDGETAGTVVVVVHEHLYIPSLLHSVTPHTPTPAITSA